MTINYVITDEEQRRKFVCVDPHDIPQVAFIDADMMDAIEHDRKPYVDAVAGRNALEMILAIYQSAATGKPVKLPLEHTASTDFEGRFD